MYNHGEKSLTVVKNSHNVSSQAGMTYA